MLSLNTNPPAQPNNARSIDARSTLERQYDNVHAASVVLATPLSDADATVHHVRATYRNFFAPDARWQFSGLRLAEDA